MTSFHFLRCTQDIPQVLYIIQSVQKVDVLSVLTLMMEINSEWYGKLPPGHANSF